MRGTRHKRRKEENAASNCQQKLSWCSTKRMIANNTDAVTQGSMTSRTGKMQNNVRGAEHKLWEEPWKHGYCDARTHRGKIKLGWLRVLAVCTRKLLNMFICFCEYRTHFGEVWLRVFPCCCFFCKIRDVHFHFFYLDDCTRSLLALFTRVFA